MIGYSPPGPCPVTRLLSGHRPALGNILWQQFFIVCYDHDHYLYTFRINVNRYFLSFLDFWEIIFGLQLDIRQSLDLEPWSSCCQSEEITTTSTKYWRGTVTVFSRSVLEDIPWPRGVHCPVSKQFLRNPRNRATCLPQCNFYIYMWSQRRNRNSSTISSVCNTWLRP